MGNLWEMDLEELGRQVGEHVVLRGAGDAKGYRADDMQLVLQAKVALEAARTQASMNRRLVVATWVLAGVTAIGYMLMLVVSMA